MFEAIFLFELVPLSLPAGFDGDVFLEKERRGGGGCRRCWRAAGRAVAGGAREKKERKKEIRARGMTREEAQ